MFERPLKVQIPFVLFAWPFIVGAVSAQHQGPWLVALIVYALAGGVNAVNHWPIAYRTWLVDIVARFLLIAVGALAVAVACEVIVTGNIGGLFAPRSR